MRPAVPVQPPRRILGRIHALMDPPDPATHRCRPVGVCHSDWEPVRRTGQCCPDAFEGMPVSRRNRHDATVLPGPFRCPVVFLPYGLHGLRQAQAMWSANDGIVRRKPDAPTSARLSRRPGRLTGFRRRRTAFGFIAGNGAGEFATRVDPEVGASPELACAHGRRRDAVLHCG